MQPVSAVATQPLKQISIQLFTRQQCSLCNHAKYFINRIKRRYPEEVIKLEEVYIDENPELTNKYNDVIPVIMVNEKEVCREKPHERLIREAVEKELQTTNQKTIEQLQLEMQQNQLKVEEMQEMEHLLRKTIFRGLRATIVFVSAMLVFFKVMKKKNEDTKTQKLKQNTVVSEKQD